MLHSRRRRLKALAEAEAAGQSFWTHAFGDSARMRLWYAFVDAAGSEQVASHAASIARSLIMTDEGLGSLSSAHYTSFADLEAARVAALRQSSAPKSPNEETQS